MLEIDDILFPIQSLKLLTAACNPIPVSLERHVPAREP